VVDARQLDVFRSGDAFRHESGAVDVDIEVAGAVQDQRRDANRRKDVADVDLRVHAG
jgi:hypothetical protein